MNSRQESFPRFILTPPVSFKNARSVEASPQSTLTQSLLTRQNMLQFTAWELRLSSSIFKAEMTDSSSWSCLSSCHVRAQGLQWWGGHKQTQGHTMAMHLPALPQAKTTPQASHSSLLIDPYCKQDQVTQMLNLNTTCGTTADNQTQEGFVRLINRKDSCTFQILHHSWQVTLRTCDYIW